MQQARPPQSLEQLITRIKPYVKNNKLVILLIGRTGMGKSSMGNGIIGREVFPVGDIRSCTSEPKMETRTLFGLEIVVIDSPGFLDDRGIETDAKNARSVLEFTTRLIDGVDVVLYTSTFIARVDQSEQNLIKSFSTLFTSEAGTHLWTHAGAVLTGACNPVQKGYASHKMARIPFVQENIQKFAPTNVLVPVCAFESLSPNGQLPDGTPVLVELFSMIHDLVRVNQGRRIMINLPKEKVEIIKALEKASKAGMSSEEIAAVLAPIVVTVFKFVLIPAGCTIL